MLRCLLCWALRDCPGAGLVPSVCVSLSLMRWALRDCPGAGLVPSVCVSLSLSHPGWITFISRKLLLGRYSERSWECFHLPLFLQAVYFSFFHNVLFFLSFERHWNKIAVVPSQPTCHFMPWGQDEARHKTRNCSHGRQKCLWCNIDDVM